MVIFGVHQAPDRSVGMPERALASSLSGAVDWRLCLVAYRLVRQWLTITYALATPSMRWTGRSGISGNFGELGITYGRSINVSHFLHTEVEHNWFWDLRMPKPHSLGAIMDVCWLLKDIASLGCDHPSALTGLVLDHPQQIDSKATDGRLIRPYMTAIGNYGSDRRGSMSQENMLFTLRRYRGTCRVGKVARCSKSLPNSR